MTVLVKGLKNGPLEISGRSESVGLKAKSTPMPEIRFISVVAANQRVNRNAMAATPS